MPWDEFCNSFTQKFRQINYSLIWRIFLQKLYKILFLWLFRVSEWNVYFRQKKWRPVNISNNTKTQLLTLLHKKLLWQNGSTLASHAIGPGFKPWSRHMSFCWKICVSVCYDFPVTTITVGNHATFHHSYLEDTLVSKWSK